MNFARALISLLLVSLLAACSGLDIETWEPTEFASGNYKTYSWRTEPILNTTYSRDPIYQIDPLLREAVDSSLQAKGYRKVARTGDFSVDYIFATGVVLGTPSQDASNISPRAGVRPNTGISQAERDNAIALAGVKETRNVALQINDSNSGHEVWRAVITKIVANVNSTDGDRTRTIMGTAINKAISELPPAT